MRRLIVYLNNEEVGELDQDEYFPAVSKEHKRPIAL